MIDIQVQYGHLQSTQKVRIITVYFLRTLF